MVNVGDLISSDINTDHIYIHSGLSNTITGSFAYPVDAGFNISVVVDDSGNLVTCDSSNDYIFTHSGISNTLTGSFAGTSTGPKGLTIISGNLLNIDLTSRHIYQHSGISSTILGSVNIAGIDGTPRGLSHNNGSVLFTGQDNAQVFALSGLSTTVVGSSATPNTLPRGIDVYNNNLISTDVGTGFIYFHSGISNTLTGSFAGASTSPWGVSVYNFSQGGLTETINESLTLGETFTEVFTQTKQTFTETITDSITIGETIIASLISSSETFIETINESITLTEAIQPNFINEATAKIKTKITISGVAYSDYRNLQVNKAVGEFNTSSSFSVLFDSPFGRHKTDFSVGDEIKIYADKSSGTPTTLLLYGIIEKVSFMGSESTQTVTLTGRDFTQRLLDITVEPVVYSDSEVSTIVTNIIQNNVIDITTTNVNVTDTTIKRISFNHLTVYDALKQLAELSGYAFYIDNNKDLHFEEKNITSSGINLNNTNILNMKFNQTREQMANNIWVYGDRQLAGFREFQTAGSPVGGSVFTLLSKPHNTYVESLGSPLKGGVFELTYGNESGINYLVSYNDKQIIFTSGTDIGNSIPASGGSVLFDYKREIPIVKTGANRQSIALYGQKNKIINDKSIKDPNTAVAILNAELSKADPFRGMEIDYKGWLDITPGNTLNVVLSDFGINEDVGVLDVTYTFDKNRIHSERIIKFRLNKKILDITDEFSKFSKRIDLLEAQDRQDTDIITRLESSVGSVTIVGSAWNIQSSSVTGSAYHIYSTGFVPPINPFHTASGTDEGLCAGSFTGSAQAFSDFQIVLSGGYY